MNAPWVSHFTIVNVDEWSLLFIGDRLVQQSHATVISDLVRHSDNKPFTLEVIDASGTDLDAQLTAVGEAPMNMGLGQARYLAGSKP